MNLRASPATISLVADTPSPGGSVSSGHLSASKALLVSACGSRYKIDCCQGLFGVCQGIEKHVCLFVFVGGGFYFSVL